MILWQKAIPARQRIKDVEEVLKREFIDTINPAEIQSIGPRVISSAAAEELGYHSYGEYFLSNEREYQKFFSANVFPRIKTDRSVDSASLGFYFTIDVLKCILKTKKNIISIVVHVCEIDFMTCTTSSNLLMRNNDITSSNIHRWKLKL